MLHQGYVDLGPAIVGQDNVNGIAMMEKGKSDNFRSKHINVRYFFMKDRIASKEVKFVYVPTLETLADFMTKPLQGALFKKLRDHLLGRDTEYMYSDNGSLKQGQHNTVDDYSPQIHSNARRGVLEYLK